MLFALFQIVSIPFCLCNRSFNELTLAFSLVLSLAIAGGVAYRIKTNTTLLPKGWQGISLFFTGVIPRKLTMTKWERVYFLFFLTLLIIQIFGVAILDIGGRAADDATYVALANDAITHNQLYRIDPMTGHPAPFDIQRALQGSLLLFAYIAKITGLHVAAVFHTYLAVVLLLVAYSVYGLLGVSLMDSRENQWIFLLFVALLYMFGFYSDYSMTFRLLGPIWQGKAILEVILTPFLFVILPNLLERPFHIRHAIYLAMLGTAAISMTMGGAIVMVAMTFLLVPLFLIRTRAYKTLWYIPFACAMPGICVMLYLGLR